MLAYAVKGHTCDEDSDEGSGKGAKVAGYVLEFDAARKIAQGLGIHLEKSESIVEVKGDKARLLPVAERTQYLFGKATEAAPTGPGRRRTKKAQKTTLPWKRWKPGPPENHP